MAQNNWAKNKDMNPGFVPEQDQEMYPAMGRGAAQPGYIPDPNAPAASAAYVLDKDGHKQWLTLTPGQEKYGLEYKEGDPPPVKRKSKDTGTLVPF